MKKENKKVGVKTHTIISERLKHGTVIETVLESDQTRLAIHKNGKCYLTPQDKLADGRVVVPVSAQNPLLKNGLLKLPSRPEEFKSNEELITEIREFIHRYVDLSSDFELASTYYVLLSWIYDDFNELPYLRRVGDFGSGKTRYLKVMGAIMYKSIMASGGTSTAALFHITDKFKGTLVLDEADYSFSDERTDIAKILNNGNASGFPILRVSVDSDGKYTPISYDVYCPKIIASRSHYQDQALESRFITEPYRATVLRSDIPISLPEAFEVEALKLRNKLLMYRFSNLNKVKLYKIPNSYELEGRINQIFSPLLSVVKTPKHREILIKLAQHSSAALKEDRTLRTEALVLNVIKGLHEAGEKLLITNITNQLILENADCYQSRVTSKWVGSIIRKKLNLQTHRTNEGYIIKQGQDETLNHFYKRYGCMPS